MRDDKLGKLSMELAVDILQLTKELHLMHENIISNQIGRSGTSIGANIREAKYAHGTAADIGKQCFFCGRNIAKQIKVGYN